MPPTTKRRGRPPKEERLTFIFEIASWQPEYLLSIDYDRYRLRPYNEYAHIRLSTVCIHPQKWAGRKARITVMGAENFMTPEVLKRNPEWIPNCVAAIDLPPSNGDFSLAVPMERLPFLMTAFSAGMFRYLLLWGPPLKRSRSMCSSAHFERTVDLSEY